MLSSKEKLHNLMRDYLKDDVIVAFSGGADSSLLLKSACVTAKEWGSRVYAVTMHTTLHTMNEIEISKRVAKEVGAEHIIISVDELKEAGIENNPVDRCYLCKKYLFKQILKKAAELNVKTILEGSNEDDLHVYRPGLKAIKELGIISPLAEAGMTKKEVRELAAEYNISVSNKPAAPCLATRFPYGVKLSYEAMSKVAEGEEYIKSFGFYNVRLRVHGEILRIEIDKNDFIKMIEIKDQVISYLKKLGYHYITLDLEGFRSGSMDIFI